MGECISQAVSADSFCLLIFPLSILAAKSSGRKERAHHTFRKIQNSSWACLERHPEYNNMLNALGNTLAWLQKGQKFRSWESEIDSCQRRAHKQVKLRSRQRKRNQPGENIFSVLRHLLRLLMKMGGIILSLVESEVKKLEYFFQQKTLHLHNAC